MAINFDFAKKFAAEQVIKQAMHYLERDPEKNFIKVLDLANKIARPESQHKKIAAIKEAYQANPVMRQYVQKLSCVASSYKEGLIMNFLLTQPYWVSPGN